MAGFRRIGDVAGSRGMQELEGALRRAARAPDGKNESTPVRRRQGGLVADGRYTRLPGEFFGLGERGVPGQALLLYAVTASYDHGKGPPFVGLGRVARQMGMSRQAVARWVAWWVERGLLRTTARGRVSWGKAGVPRGAAPYATVWNWGGLHGLMWSIRRGEIDEEGVNERLQLGGPEGDNLRLQLTDNLCTGNCKPREARSEENRGLRAPKQLTEADDIIERGEDENSKSLKGVPLTRDVLCPQEDRDEDGKKTEQVDPSRSGFFARIWALIGIARRRK